MYSRCIALVTDAVTSVVGLTLQQGPNTLLAEVPFLHAFSETGCALWRLAQCALAKAGLLREHQVVNQCHLVLEHLPLILIEGSVESSRLCVCPSTSQALCPQEQVGVWAASTPYEYCAKSVTDFPTEPSMFSIWFYQLSIFPPVSSFLFKPLQVKEFLRGQLQTLVVTTFIIFRAHLHRKPWKLFLFKPHSGGGT